jgi:hypothetical protein
MRYNFVIKSSALASRSMHQDPSDYEFSVEESMKG